jgi:hypothetical protein
VPRATTTTEQLNKKKKKKNTLGNIVTAYFHFHSVDVFFPTLRGERK